MAPIDPIAIVVLPLGLGLLGFIEPCSIGSTLIFIKSLEGRDPTTKFAQVGLFALTRATIIGLMGMAAVLIGTAFVGLQQAMWILLGAIYLLIGVIYATGRADRLAVRLGPSLAGLSNP